MGILWIVLSLTEAGWWQWRNFKFCPPPAENTIRTPALVTYFVKLCLLFYIAFLSRIKWSVLVGPSAAISFSQRQRAPLTLRPLPPPPHCGVCSYAPGWWAWWTRCWWQFAAVGLCCLMGWRGHARLTMLRLFRTMVPDYCRPHGQDYYLATILHKALITSPPFAPLIH